MRLLLLVVSGKEVTEARKQATMVRTKADSVPGSYRKGKIQYVFLVLLIIIIIIPWFPHSLWSSVFFSFS